MWQVRFLLSIDGELREPLVWPQGSPVSFRVARGSTTLLSCTAQESGFKRIERGISRSFSRCSKKSCVPSTCDADLSELLRVPIGSQKYCGFGRGLL